MITGTKYIVRTSEPDLFGVCEWLAHWFDPQWSIIRTKIFVGTDEIWDGEKVCNCSNKDEVRDRAKAEFDKAYEI